MSTETRRPTLPHRAPFLLLDTVLDVAPGRSARAEKLVSSNDPLVRDDTTASAALVLEALAQCAGVAAASAHHDPSGALVAVDRFQVHGTIRPGDRLIVEAQIVKTIGTMLMVRATAHVAGELRAEGHLVLRLGALPK